jgi:hypothetical protein
MLSLPVSVDPETRSGENPMILIVCAALQISDHAATAKASTELAGKGRYAARNAFDGDPATAWVEGAKGLGEGSTLTLTLAEPARIAGFALVAGYARSTGTFVQNAAPRAVAVFADGKKLLDLRIPYVEAWDEQAARCVRTGAPRNLEGRLVVLSHPATARVLELRLGEVSAGSRFEDTAISEWRPLFEGAPADPALAALLALRDGKPRLAPDAKADALLPWPAPGEFPDYDRFLAERLGGAPLPPAEAFLRALGPSFLDRAVLVRDGHLLGGMAFTHGDGEWNELYPELVLDAQGRLAELNRAFHQDGAPGCRNALPEK